MKKIVITVFVLFTVSCISVFGQTPWNGTVDIDWWRRIFDTHIITTAEQLAGLAEVAKYYPFEGDTIILGADIDLNNLEWTPIGCDKSNVDWNSDVYLDDLKLKLNSFRGTFDGNGKTISNLKITGGEEDLFNGLFSIIGDKGIVKNLAVSGAVSGGNCVGGIAGMNDGTVQNCYSTVTVTGNASLEFGGNFCLSIGGIVGENYSGTIRNCYSTGTVTGGKNVGGVAGDNLSGTILNCYSTSAVTGVNSVGGVVGRNVGGTVQNCVALNTSVSHNTDPYFTVWVGRVLGDNGIFDGEIKNNYARTNMRITQQGGRNKPTLDKGLGNNIDGADCADIPTTAWWKTASNWNHSEPQNTPTTGTIVRTWTRHLKSWDDDDSWNFVDGSYPTLKQP